MVQVGEVVFLICRGKVGKIRVRGTLIEEGEDGNVVLAISPDLAAEIPQSANREKVGESGVGFIKVPAHSISSSTPAGWGTSVGGSPPKLEKALPIWDRLSKEVGLQSSEAEAVENRPREAASSKQRTLEKELLQMSQELWKNQSSDSGTSDSEDDPPRARSSGRHLAPGAGAVNKPKSKRVEEDNSGAEMSALMQKMMVEQLGKGSSPSDLMPMMMMQMLMNQQQKDGSKKSKHRRRRREEEEDRGTSSSGSSSNEDLPRDGGMKAVVALNRLHKRIRRRPKSIIREFEKDLVEDLGVVAGQAWSLRDWLKKQPWGKFKGLYRCAVQDAIAYEMIRNGDHDAAGAQIIQNLKAKLQAVLAGGDWSAAWLLTGIQDPLSKREWAGSREEMAIISGYTNSLHKLKKKVKEASAAAGSEELQE